MELNGTCIARGVREKEKRCMYNIMLRRVRGVWEKEKGVGMRLCCDVCCMVLCCHV